MPSTERNPEVSKSRRVLIEVCVGSVADIEAAVGAGADRIELCAALELGGLTPSIGLFEAALAASSLPIIVMLRPRPGGFRYDRHEFAQMRRDAERLLELGAAGVAFGVLTQQGQVDVPRCRELVEQASGRETAFHRAFDFVADQPAALNQLNDLGCTRVLTSGGAASAKEGMAVIRTLVQRAAGRVEIMAGGGINAENIVEIVEATGCRQIHIGAAMPADDGSILPKAPVELCDHRFMRGHVHRAVDRAKVAAALAALQNR